MVTVAVGALAGGEEADSFTGTGTSQAGAGTKWNPGAGTSQAGVLLAFANGDLGYFNLAALYLAREMASLWESEAINAHSYLNGHSS